MNDEFESWNDELAEEVSVKNPSSLVVFSRDWTVDTIVNQVAKGYIDLNPAFQRRNAWSDEKRSKLIESLLVGIPVPEIVLAEDKNKKRSYVVIDGKQRLLALAGYINPSLGVWNSAKLRSLTTRRDLNGKQYVDLSDGGEEGEDQRSLQGADIRCTVISNYSDNNVLYDIFYRLNTGSVPLSSQELRQVLIHGDFANYLIQTTNQTLPLHSVMRLSGPDNRLRDAEILLRYIAFSIYGKEYDGNLTPFLDKTMQRINQNWVSEQSKIANIVEGFNKGTQRLLSIFPQNRVGRKFGKEVWESRFNRALFEVQVYYFALIDDASFNAADPGDVVLAFQKLCDAPNGFLDSIETSTKTIDRYQVRFSLFEYMVNVAFKVSINAVPVSKPR